MTIKLNELGEDILGQVAAYLSGPDLKNLLQTSKKIDEQKEKILRDVDNLHRYFKNIENVVESSHTHSCIKEIAKRQLHDIQKKIISPVADVEELETRNQAIKNLLVSAFSLLDRPTLDSIGKIHPPPFMEGIAHEAKTAKIGSPRHRIRDLAWR